MANSMYGLGREGFGEGLFDWLTDTVALAMFTTAYSPNLTTDHFYSTPIASGGLVGAKTTLTGVSGSLGTFSAANVTFTSVSGSTASYLVLFKDTGTNSSSNLWGLIDTATGLPVTPNGGNITVAWASGQVFTLFAGLADRERHKGWLENLIADFFTGKWKPKFGEIYFPTPRIIMHDPTPAQKIKHAQWLDERRRAEDVEKEYARKFGRPVPII